MHKKRLGALISISAVMLSSVSLPAYAEATKMADRYLEMQKPDEVAADSVTINDTTHSFTQPIVYTTFNKDRDPKDILEKTIEIDGLPYLITETSETTVISKEDVKPLTKTIITDTFMGDENSVDNQPNANIYENGIQYRMSGKVLQDGNVTERKEFKATEITFTGVEDSISIPKTKVIEINDTPTGQTIDAELKLSDEQVVNEYWASDFEFPITVTGYGSYAFMLNGKSVPGDADLIDYKDDLLTMLNLNKDAYQVTSIDWSGDAYMQNGQMVRNAVAKGSKYVKDIKATYEAEVELPAMQEKSWKVTYSEVFPEGNTLYTMKTDATYTLDSSMIESRSGLAGVVDAVVGTITAAYSAVIESVKEKPVLATIPIVLVALFAAFFVTRSVVGNKLPSDMNGNI